MSSISVNRSPRSMRPKVAPSTQGSRTSIRHNFTSKKDMTGRHHSPDVAAGGSYFQMGMVVPYCQEIKTNQSTSRKKLLDPLDVNTSRDNNHPRRSGKSSTRRCLEPLAEDSYEDSSARRNISSPERNAISTITTQSQKGKSHKYSNYELDSIGYLRSHKQHPKQTITSTSQVRAQSKTGSVGVNASANRETTEQKSRGLDPPEKGHKPSNMNATGPQDPPAHDGRKGLAYRHKLHASPKKPTINNRSTTSKSLRGSTTKSSSSTSIPKSRRPSSNVRRQSNNSRRSSTSRKKQSKSKVVSSTIKQNPAPKSILKKKTDEAPPPIAFFGGEPDSQSKSSLSNEPKTTPPPESASDDSEDETISIDMESAKSSNSMKSALRRGKFAANNTVSSSTTTDYGHLSLSSTSNSTFTDEGDNVDGFKFDRTRSHFLRTADLGLTQDTIFAQQFLDDPNSTPEPHYHHPSPHPPPGVQFHIDENWICVDHNGRHSPIAPQAVDALVSMGYKTINDPVMWTPTSKTRAYMTEKRLTFDSMPIPGPIFEGLEDCLIWTGKFNHRYYGSDLPVIRSQGIVNKSAEELVDLLMDSSRVDEYNKSSVGRTDEIVLSYGLDENCPFSGRKKKKLTGVVMQGAKIIDGTAFVENDDEQSDFEDSSSRHHRTSNFVGVTKLVRSTNKVPLVKKALEFTTLLHCRELLDEQGGNGYIIVGRSITPGDDAVRGKSTLQSEVLLNVSIIRRLHQSDNGTTRSVSVGTSGRTASKKDLRNRCLLITMNHVKSPLIPKLIAKRVGKSAAANFMSDIRSA